MKFNAIVSSRSSKKSDGPPGEAEVLRLNPQRLNTLLTHTGWERLNKGTLNLEVDESVVNELRMLDPAVREPGDTVKYPDRYSHIPLRRGAYLYFYAILNHGGKSETVLIRTAENPLKGRLEAFAPVQLREALCLSDGDEVTCVIGH
jgi:CTP-dependent riboflavin kinase